MIYIYSNISCYELKKIIGSINIIDIREEYLYRLSNIPTSKNIPYKYLDLNPDSFLDKNKTYYIYCSFGKLSSNICLKLYNMGYKVINIIGGFDSYISK